MSLIIQLCWPFETLLSSSDFHRQRGGICSWCGQTFSSCLPLQPHFHHSSLCPSPTKTSWCPLDFPMSCPPLGTSWLDLAVLRLSSSFTSFAALFFCFFVFIYLAANRTDQERRDEARTSIHWLTPHVTIFLNPYSLKLYPCHHQLSSENYMFPSMRGSYFLWKSAVSSLRERCYAFHMYSPHLAFSVAYSGDSLNVYLNEWFFSAG